MKLSFLLMFLFWTLFSNCQKSSLNPNNRSHPAVTYEEIVAGAESEGIPLEKIGLQRNWDAVLAVAANYGLADEFRDQERVNNSLMFTTEDKLKTYFEDAKQTYELRRQNEIYREKLLNVQSLSDYFNLLDALPLCRKARFPSEEAYAARKELYFSPDYRVYISEPVTGPNNRVHSYLIVLTRPEQVLQEKARLLEKR